MTDPSNSQVPSTQTISGRLQPSRETRRQQFEALFNQTTPVVQQNLDLKKVLKQYEDAHNRELRIWWNVTALKKYHQERIIPRGLRLRKAPTTVYSQEFSIRWNEILTEASLKLIALIIEVEEEKLKQYEIEIDQIVSNLEPLKTLQSFESTFKLVEDRLETLEKSILDLKHRKYLRDVEDYQLDQVQSWRKRYPAGKKPAIKSKNKKYRKLVSFPTTGSSEGSQDYPTDNIVTTGTSGESSASEVSSKNGEGQLKRSGRRMNLRSTAIEGGGQAENTAGAKKGKT